MTTQKPIRLDYWCTANSLMLKDKANIYRSATGLSPLAPQCDNVTTQRERRGWARSVHFQVTFWRNMGSNRPWKKVIILDNEAVHPEELLISITITRDVIRSCQSWNMNYSLSHRDEQRSCNVTHLSSREPWKSWLPLGAEEPRLTLQKRKSRHHLSSQKALIASCTRCH